MTSTSPERPAVVYARLLRALSDYIRRGLRETDEPVERIGVERARSIVEDADVLLWLGDPADAPSHPRLVQVHPRADLPERANASAQSLAVSSVTGQGLKPLLARVKELGSSFLPAEGAIALNRRQAVHFGEAADALAQAADAEELVIIAENLRAARSAFDRLTGRAGLEDVLDALFARFCLGK